MSATIESSAGNIRLAGLLGTTAIDGDEVDVIMDHETSEQRSGKARNFTKRTIDIVVAAIAIFLSLPVLLLVAIAVLVQDGRPIFYRHRRIGKGGKEFDCLKIRTMVKDSQARLETLLGECEDSRREWEETQKLRKDPRILPVGNLLRKTSLDELPQLLNVLRGEMSLVGPRPIVQQEVQRYGTDFSYYTSVYPGITGIWQVSGRSDTGYDSRVAYDVQYAKEQSVVLDAKILLKTVYVVALGRGSC